uniref:Uncharacterized protein n=1 Tax=Panagrolaimus sp. ES5 TaxID=591445 RepID=A0AC34FK42_9BILA
MNLSNSSNATASILKETTASKTRKRKADDDLKLDVVPSKRDLFLSTYRRRQDWSLPESIIYYMAKNPKNAEVYLKLVQSCKYFFVMNPIIVAKNLKFNYKDQEWEASSKNDRKCIDLKNNSTKFWITDVFDNCLYKATPNLASIIPHLYQVDVKKLCLTSDVISFTDFLFLSSNVEDLIVRNVKITNIDDTPVSLEKLVEVLPNLKNFNFHDIPDSLSVTSNTVKELLKLPNFKKLNKFEISGIKESFDVDTFFAHIKEVKHLKVYLSFNVSISEAFKTRLEIIVDEILDTQNHDYEPPLIYFSGLDFFKWLTMVFLYQDD